MGLGIVVSCLALSSRLLYKSICLSTRTQVCRFIFIYFFYSSFLCISSSGFGNREPGTWFLLFGPMMKSQTSYFDVMRRHFFFLFLTPSNIAKQCITTHSKRSMEFQAFRNIFGKLNKSPTKKKRKKERK